MRHFLGLCFMLFFVWLPHFSSPASAQEEGRVQADRYWQEAEARKLAGHFGEAAGLYEQSAQAEKASANPRLADLSAELKNAATNYYKIEQFDKAADLFREALAIDEKRLQELQTTISVDLNNIGSVYYAWNRPERALPYYQQALAMDRKLDNQEKIAVRLGNLGMLYYAKQEYPTALKYYQEALAIARQRQNPAGVSVYLENMALVQAAVRQFDAAIRSYQEVLAVARSQQDEEKIGLCLRRISQLEQRRADVMGTPTEDPEMDRSTREKPAAAVLFSRADEQATQEAETSVRTLSGESVQETCQLTVQTEPPEAHVRILNIQPVYRPGMALAPGNYHLDVRHPGYVTVDRWITLADQDWVEEIILQPDADTFHLTVKTQPEDAKVRILNIIAPYEPGLLLKPGNYRLEVSHPHYETRHRWLKMGREDQVFSVRLKALTSSAPASETEDAREPVSAMSAFSVVAQTTIRPVQNTTPPDSTGQPRYAIRMGTYRSEKLAHQVMMQYHQRGFEVYRVNPGEGQEPAIYSVSIGPFEGWSRAASELEKLREGGESDAFIGPFRPSADVTIIRPPSSNDPTGIP